MNSDIKTIKRKRNNIKSIAISALFSALICVFSLVAIPLPFTNVPLSLGIFAIFITAATLPTASALSAVAAYILLGAIGLPVFASFKGGFDVLFSYTGGYIWGYLPLTLICSLFIKKCGTKKRRLIKFVGMILGLSVCYFCGALQFAAVSDLSFAKTISATILPFIPFDIFKAVMATELSERLSSLMKSIHLP